MKESIGGAQVLMISVIILLVMIVVLSASIGYTKAFKARNAIINIVQKYAEYGESPDHLIKSSEDGFTTAGEEIYQTLKDMGYMINAGSGKSCEDRFSDAYTEYEVYKDDQYNFCIYRFADSNGNQHYGVQTYMYFELPIFGKNDRFSFPIYGDTFTFFKYGI